MVEITLKIDGMACGMCEAHINSAIREAFRIKRVKSSYKKGITVIIAEQPILEAELRSAVEQTGYKVLELSCIPQKRKTFFKK